MRPTQLPARHPYWVLFAVLGLALWAAAALVDFRTGEARLWIDPGIEQLLPSNDPERRYAEKASHLFLSDEPLFAVFGVDDVLAIEHLELLAELRDALLELPGVRDVLSLTELPHVQSFGDEIEVHSILATLRQSPELRDEVMASLRNHMAWGWMISEDGRYSALVVSFEAMSDREFLASALDEVVRSVVESGSAGQVNSLWISGVPVLKAETSRALVRQLRTVIPAIGALSALVLFFAFGSVRGVVLPLATIGLSVLFTGALLAWWGRPLNLVTTIIPPLLLTVGLAYTMHFMSEYAEESGAVAHSEAERVAAALAAVGLPLMVAGLTTAGGFGALAVNPLGAIREFGILATLGTAITVALTMTFLPACLAIWGRVRASRAAPGAGVFGTVGASLGHLALRHRRLIIVAGLALFGVAILGTLRISVGTSYIENFDPDTRVRSDYEAVREHMGGATAFQIVLETEEDDAFLEPAVMQEVVALQEWLEAQPEIGPTLSLVDYLEMLHRDWMGEPGLPEDRALARQLIMLAGGDYVQRFTDSRHRTGNLIVRTRVDDSQAISALIARVETRLAELPASIQGHATGNSILLNHTLERIARGQLWSIVAAFGVIYLILAAVFMSARVAFLGLLPNALPVAIFFGVLGFAGIPLNPTTSLVACIALGIAVDDTTHYMVRFGSAARRFASEERAALETLRAVLRPVTLTSVALVGGFLVLATSELRNQVQFGVLAAATLAAAWVIDVTLTPALTAGARIVNFWDVLRFDLGSEPQKEIPIFEGLSARQTRVFALMMDIRVVRSGEMLMRQGDTGVRDIYAVLEGEFEVSSERGENPPPPRTARRGELLGALSHYTGTRTATVRALTDSRLLRIEERDLDELLRRYPKIAAPIYKNLGYAQTDAAMRYIERDA